MLDYFDDDAITSLTYIDEKIIHFIIIDYYHAIIIFHVFDLSRARAAIIDTIITNFI